MKQPRADRTRTRMRTWSKAAWAVAAGFALTVPAAGNPYPEESKVPKDPAAWQNPTDSTFDESEWGPVTQGSPVLRVDLVWDKGADKFSFKGAVKENSGTPALIKRSANRQKLGSYVGVLVDPESKQEVAFDAVGTGHLFSKLSRAANFRFPMPEKKMLFRLIGENRKTGAMEKIMEFDVDPALATVNPQQFNPELSEKIYKRASVADSEKLLFTVYAEGYKSGEKSSFDQHVNKLIKAMKDFPGLEKLEIKGVFGPSNLKIGKAPQRNPPTKITVRDSFLGLYYPFWMNFGRWYHVAYPTSEEKFHNALGSAAYDYPFAMVDSSDYWGVGNYMSHTAVPSRNGSFRYLVWHELGHFFGLNEEYNSGGRTELEFSPGIKEPWSQNITFDVSGWDNLKWNKYVSRNTPIPTKRWSKGKWGAYRGGYAQSEPKGKSHIPGSGCMMSSGKTFCKICYEAIKEQIDVDLGKKPVNMSYANRPPSFLN